MNGVIKTFIPSKGYGFISGSDGKDYFFHIKNFSENVSEEDIYDGLKVVFSEGATKKGYVANYCKVVDKPTDARYDVPGRFMLLKGDNDPNWDLIDISNWKAKGESRKSPSEAKQSLIDRACALGANGVIHYRMDRNTESNGNYQYTVHQCSGHLVSIGKKSTQGSYLLEDLKGHVNQRAEDWYQKISSKEYTRRKKNLITMLAISVIVASYSFVQDSAWPVVPAIIIAVAGITGYAKQKTFWLSKLIRN